ncbi:hypothetical protein Cgig2_014871 [Carnegiea gigantea]|uniref:Uncharacterized protein n=1 Tax=Carnegiea gigantea TaxID=171969 RepID=A0A9Q1L248_9CARY|nr:hypothetical protein Cgig2_014871 [Carnegiea gigantea]
MSSCSSSSPPPPPPPPSSSLVPPLPENHVVVCFTCPSSSGQWARLHMLILPVMACGLNPRLISKIADDVHGKGMLKELEADGIDTSFLIEDRLLNPYSMVPLFDTRDPRLESALDGVKLVYSDVRLPEIAINMAKEIGFCGLTISLPIVSLSAFGENFSAEASESEEVNVRRSRKLLEQKIVHDCALLSCVSSLVMNLTKDGLETFCGRLHVGTAEKIFRTC